MSSSKKKKTTVECVDCSCYVLPRDLERHKIACGSALDSSEVQLVSTNEVLFAMEQTVEKWETYLSPEVFGWSKHHSVFLHPDTMIQLGVIPRQPCIYQKSDIRRIVIVWPCEMVSQLRICLGKKASSGLCKLIPINGFAEVKNLCLRPLEYHDLYGTQHFKEYITAFLSGSYVTYGEVIQFPFYGAVYEFSVEQTLIQQLGNMTVSDSVESVMKVAPKFVVSIIGIQKGAVSKNRLSFVDFGGNKIVKENLMALLISPLKRNFKGVSAIISGISGTGKSLLLHVLADELGPKGLTYNDSEEFDEQLSYLDTDKPCCLIIDNFGQSSNAQNSNIMEKLSSFMDKHDNVSVVIAVQDVDKISLSLRRRFVLELELTVPSFYERIEILRILFRDHSCIDSEMILEIARNTHGFTGSDLQSILKLSLITGLATDKKVTMQRLNEARKQVRPTGIREIVLEVPNVCWDDIGGYQTLKDIIKQTILWPQLFPECFARFNIPPPSGILLYGPPGCCKTMVARALAAQSKLNFLAVKGPEIFSKWVGESERAVRELFRRARQVAPSILFFDEIDAVAVSRGDKGNSNVGDRVLAQLLTELDGLEKKSGVVVLAATNRPDMLDGAILRPGRLDRSIYVTLPDEHARRSILMLQSANVKMHDSVDVDVIVAKTKGYSGAEMVAVYRNAALIALREDREAEYLKMDHFLKSLEEVVPRTEKWMLELYDAFEKGHKF